LLHQAISRKKEKGNIWLEGKCGKIRGGEMLKKAVSHRTIRKKVCKGEV
jgi:hypothetical protein